MESSHILPRKFDAADLGGLKYFKPIQKLLEELHDHCAHPNRLLHYDEYIALLLLYFFNPMLQSLRDLQKVSDLKSVAAQLGVRRASLGSLSEASHVFDPDALRAIFLELADQAAVLNGPPRPAGVPADLAVIAADGTLLDALPKMLWALWLGPHDKAVKVHLQFDILRGAPVDMELTDGNGSETEVLKNHLAAGRLYVIDRGYMNYSLYQNILDAKSSFVARLRANADCQVVERRPLSAESKAAGVEADEVVWLGGEKTSSRPAQKLRRVKVHVKNPPHHGLKPRMARVSRKVKSVRVSEDEFDVWLITDRMDLLPEIIALLYQYRWQIEIFFRWLKCTLGCRHLLAESENGIRLQMYAALIASLLIILWTGRKPNKTALLMLNLYFQGWADLDELKASIEKLKPLI
jgi:hypothetical protein